MACVTKELEILWVELGRDMHKPGGFVFCAGRWPFESSASCNPRARLTHLVPKSVDPFESGAQFLEEYFLGGPVLLV